MQNIQTQEIIRIGLINLEFNLYKLNNYPFYDYINRGFIYLGVPSGKISDFVNFFSSCITKNSFSNIPVSHSL